MYVLKFKLKNIVIWTNVSYNFKTLLTLQDENFKMAQGIFNLETDKE